MSNPHPPPSHSLLRGRVCCSAIFPPAAAQLNIQRLTQLHHYIVDESISTDGRRLSRPSFLLSSLHLPALSIRLCLHVFISISVPVCICLFLHLSICLCMCVCVHLSLPACISEHLSLCLRASLCMSACLWDQRNRSSVVCARLAFEISACQTTQGDARGMHKSMQNKSQTEQKEKSLRLDSISQTYPPHSSGSCGPLRPQRDDVQPATR